VLSSKKLFGLTMFAVVLLAILSAGPALATEAPQAALPAVAASPVPVNCGLGATLPGQAVKGEVCSAAQPESALELPDFMANKKLGYCHCGCSSVPTCRTSADCGGASCDRFISCC
jgi:hypothetical protein